MTQTTDKPKRPSLYCSFCGKSQHEVSKLDDLINSHIELAQILSAYLAFGKILNRDVVIDAVFKARKITRELNK